MHYFSYDLKLRLLAHSRNFLANQKARNAIGGAENLLMVFKLLFLLSLVLGSVFLDAIDLVEYEDEISSLGKLEWGFAERIFFYQSCLSQ